MNMYYAIRLCEVALQVTATQNVELAKTDPKMWELASKQYESFAPGKYEWPALLRKMDRLDPSYKH